MSIDTPNANEPLFALPYFIDFSDKKRYSTPTLYIVHFVGSSNGRTTVSGTVYLGSSPGPTANTSALETRR
ncbi:MAG: hypothetical protein JWL92_287 [Candidatus Nomurabacteria bacterium]|nr:hypothetical protein [Candidatus Nomurabacteria bacterium]